MHELPVFIFAVHIVCVDFDMMDGFSLLFGCVFLRHVMSKVLVGWDLFNVIYFKVVVISQETTYIATTDPCHVPRCCMCWWLPYLSCSLFAAVAATPYWTLLGHSNVPLDGGRLNANCVEALLEDAIGFFVAMCEHALTLLEL